MDERLHGVAEFILDDRPDRLHAGQEVVQAPHVFGHRVTEEVVFGRLARRFLHELLRLIHHLGRRDEVGEDATELLTEDLVHTLNALQRVGDPAE